MSIKRVHIDRRIPHKDTEIFKNKRNIVDKVLYENPIMVDDLLETDYDSIIHISTIVFDDFNDNHDDYEEKVNILRTKNKSYFFLSPLFRLYIEYFRILGIKNTYIRCKEKENITNGYFATFDRIIFNKAFNKFNPEVKAEIAKILDFIHIDKSTIYTKVYIEYSRVNDEVLINYDTFLNSRYSLLTLSWKRKIINNFGNEIHTCNSDKYLCYYNRIYTNKIKAILFPEDIDYEEISEKFDVDKKYILEIEDRINFEEETITIPNITLCTFLK